ncbi:DUF4167 domain-containing protein [Novosphingobium sp. Gsoil 351]|uniref:DUF4167 domain-containing protein n=1 Tax=Novosphingobium sp. Gsoil 351 TaxID=2675225 RepID=UPI0012B4D5EA|nr:DUF4167 domain-containing protein [Novosphingobium sp. Gsoil 351]QGN54672.1 DUF4167 domain-containing protein [Novosphingobium sp. Gsoil 351]
MNNNSNNNRNNNNRRRGRGNNNRPQGGGQQLNRIDSRARGNAPQMLEKYRKLAQDAHLNGDRVQAEYYLQFADHYFRVSADTRVRQDEQRGGRPNERPGEGGGFDESDENEFGAENDIPGFDQPMNYRREESREAREPREERQPRDQRPPDGAREARGYEQRGPQRPRGEESQANGESNPLGSAAEGEAPAPNPFVRNTRGLRPRRDREERPVTGGPVTGGDAEAGEPIGFDASILPPAIAESRAQVIANEAEAEEAPAPRRRGRPRKTPLPDGGEPLEVVTG